MLIADGFETIDQKSNKSHILVTNTLRDIAHINVTFSQNQNTSDNTLPIGKHAKTVF